MILPAVWRPDAHHDWQDCEIIGYMGRCAILQETGKLFPGRWLATFDQVRITGGILELREYASARAAASGGAMKALWAATRRPVRTLDERMAGEWP